VKGTKGKAAEESTAFPNKGIKVKKPSGSLKNLVQR
jgi:hypothetical protein